jgi:hypothetical protein
VVLCLIHDRTTDQKLLFTEKLSCMLTLVIESILDG